MAIGPIDYSVDVQQPFQAALQGYQAGATIREDQLKQRQEQQALQQQQEAKQLLARLAANPNATADDFTSAMLLIPGQSENLQKTWSIRNEAQQETHRSDLLQWGAAIKSGAPDVAANAMRQRADALERSGRADEARALRAQSDVVTTHPQLALGTIQALIASGPKGKEAADALKTFGDEQRASEQAPSKLRESVAVAEKAEKDAETADVTAKFAERKAQADLDAAGAALGLTKAQTAQAAATTRKLNVETQQAIADAAAGGDPGKRFDAETKLRKEYSDQTKGFQEVSEAYRRVRAASNDGPGDIALIYGYMKMLDPGSVVREGEFATASNSGGIPTGIQNLYNKAISGQRLTEGQRKNFTSQAGKLADAAGKREQEVRAGLSTVVKNYRLNPDNVFGTAIQAEAPAPSPAAAGQRQAVRIQTDADYNALPSGATFIAPDGTTRRKP